MLSVWCTQKQTTMPTGLDVINEKVQYTWEELVIDTTQWGAHAHTTHASKQCQYSLPTGDLSATDKQLTRGALWFHSSNIQVSPMLPLCIKSSILAETKSQHQWENSVQLLQYLHKRLEMRRYSQRYQPSSATHMLASNRWQHSCISSLRFSIIMCALKLLSCGALHTWKHGSLIFL